MADSASPIQQVQEASGAVVRVNENFDAASPAMMYGRDARTTSALNWGYLGGRYNSAVVPNGVLLLPPSSTCYVVANRNTGAVTAGTSSADWNSAGYLRLYRVETGTATIIGYEDHRQAYGLAGGFGEASPIVIPVACSDETTALTVGVAKVTFRMPLAIVLTEVRASLTTAQASGSLLTVDINAGGVSILSTKLTVDNTEKTSKTAAIPVVVSSPNLADDVEITIDIDQIGASGATGLKVYLVGSPT